VLCPDRVEGAEATRSLHICHKTNNDKRRSYNDGNSFAGFLLVEFCSIR